MTGLELASVEEVVVRSPMTSGELVEMCERAFGRQWKQVLVKELEVTISQVNRWVSGHTPISRVNELAIKSLIREHELIDA